MEKNPGRVYNRYFTIFLGPSLQSPHQRALIERRTLTTTVVVNGRSSGRPGLELAFKKLLTNCINVYGIIRRRYFCHFIKNVSYCNCFLPGNTPLTLPQCAQGIQ